MNESRVGLETNKEFTTNNAPNTDRRIDGETTLNVIYVGTALERGTGTSEDKWQIKRITETDEGAVIQYADGGEFTQVWDDRVTVTFPGDPPVPSVDELLNGVVLKDDNDDSIGQTVANPLITQGTNTTEGLSSAVKTTVISVTTSATPIPAASLTQRNSMGIHNKSGVTLYLGSSSVTADDAASTGGWELPAGQKFFFDITDSIIIFGIVAAGSASVKIMELA